MVEVNNSHTKPEQLRELLREYLDLTAFRRFVALGGHIQQIRHELGDSAPTELHDMLDVVGLLLQPTRLETVEGPGDVAAFLIARLCHLQQRVVEVLMLNEANQIMASRMVALGSDNAILMQMKDIFRAAVQANAHNLIVAFNKLTDAEPTDEEVAFVERIIECGDILGIYLLDAIIVSNGAWTSIRLRHPDLEWSE